MTNIIQKIITQSFPFQFSPFLLFLATGSIFHLLHFLLAVAAFVLCSAFFTTHAASDFKQGIGESMYDELCNELALRQYLTSKLYFPSQMKNFRMYVDYVTKKIVLHNNLV